MDFYAKCIICGAVIVVAVSLTLAFMVAVDDMPDKPNRED